MTCPICQSNMSTLLCSCGYDASRDYAKYPTFGPVGKALPPSALRSRRAPQDALRCEKCGGADFTIRIPDNTRRCSKCGWSPDEAPRLECTCGNRYFTVRLKDSMLVCPLCAKTIPLTAVLPKAPEPAKLPAPSKPVITAIAANAHYTIGLHKDGTLYSAGDVPGNLKDFSNYCFTGIAAGPSFVAALSPSGQVKITPSSSALANRVRNWSDITAIAAGSYDHLVGLNRRGIPAAAAISPHDKCAVGWHGIQAIAAGRNHTVGLKKDGTVVATGINTDKRCEVTPWTNIIAVAAGSYHTVGLKKDGTLVATGSNSLGQCDVDKLIKR